MLGDIAKLLITKTTNRDYDDLFCYQQFRNATQHLFFTFIMFMSIGWHC